MKFLLDTHILLWAVSQTELLPAAMTGVLEDTRNIVYFSVISLWEMVVKSALPRRDLKIDAMLARREALSFGFRELQVTAVHAFAVASLSSFHKDPFDRMLIAQARVEGLSLLTVDAKIRKYLAQ